MASNKDILEAQRYNRRRLITSFVAGSPEGKEVEPQAPTRPFLIGAALAVVMLLVSVGLRFLYPGADTKQSAGLAVVSSSGARYYLQDGQWHPISNRTSARLLGDSSTGTMKISDTDLAKYSQGQALGIADAPEDVPSDKNHMTADWTSCAIAERTFTWIGNSSLLKSNGLRAARSAYVAPVGGTDSYIVSGSTKFRIPAAAGETVARLRLGSSPISVNPNWLSLFDDGPDLATWTVENPGGPMDSYPQNNNSLRQGSIIAVKDTGSTTYYVLVSTGHAYPLSPLAAALYEGSPLAPNGTIETALTIQPGAFAQAFTIAKTDVEPSPFPKEWAALEGLYPFDSDSTSSGSDDDNPKVVRVRDQVPCATLEQGKSDSSGTVTTTTQQSSTTAHATLTFMSQEGARRATWNLDPTAATPASYSAGSALVKSGYGTLAQGSANGQTEAPLTFVSDLGLRHSLGDDQKDTLQRLGWGTDYVQTVPEQWLELIPSGVELSNRAARREVAGGGKS
ncbi:type VII secretion protein EccB [uncultured Actinomyces sp.]|uniref:type VII secretion protein EccB n=1 Tax=uncultured Actinomyces sp. TaxID=249061 RepID=UPI0028E93EEF|nr:type VII secretion protein EccB [uncultured Actinomyces sp.]